MRLTIYRLASAAMRSRSSLGMQVADDIDRFAQYHPTVLTLQHYVDFGTKDASAKKSFIFLNKELPVRLANIMKEFYLLPNQLLHMPSIQTVQGWYEQSFLDLLNYNKRQDSIDDRFLESYNKTLELIQNRHLTVVETMAEGILEMKREENHSMDGKTLGVDNRVQYFLDRFNMNHIGLRMLVSQHLGLFSEKHKQKDFVGVIQINCDVLCCVEDAYENARFLCEQYYMDAPDCEFICENPFLEKGKDKRITISYVPSHIYHMTFEVLKNALRAVVERHKNADSLPKIKVLICRGKTDITIKISDQGGGIRRSDLNRLFNYMYSTAPRPGSEEHTPLAGYGYGLPLSRVYAKYFNGNLVLNSVDGYGTDAMVCLKVNLEDANEVLPVFNKTSSQKYTQATQVHDWSDKSIQILHHYGK